MRRLLIAAARLIAEIALTLCRELLPSWLLGAGSPDSHGASRWARSSEKRQLGRLSKIGRASCRERV